MSVAKLKAANSAEVMKSEEPNDSLDTFIRQAIGKEPFLSFSRAGNSPVQWIQLLHTLDQQHHPGWPLLTPLKVQLQKCDKCSQEFCSPINYRRHVRVHHRLKKLDKDSAKNRDLLAAFWDKLSEDEAKGVISFEDVSLEEVPGSSVIKSLTTLVKRPGFSALPHVCLRAGSALLDIVRARPSRFPISSEELFSILDDASERTFLCGAAVSMQKYIFDGEAGKIGLETKNLVACTCFLVEQKLVKAWLADKDAEALRCQKLLVEEEEAAQKRQVELLESKRQKKLRQKEQKAKEQRPGEMEEGKENMDDSSEVNTPAETSSPLVAFDCGGQNPVISTDQVLPSVEPIHFSNPEEDADYEIQMGFSNGYCDPGTSQNVERRKEQVGGHRHIVVARWQTPPKSQRGVLNGFHASQNSHGFKFGGMNKHGTNRERAAAIGSSNKMWSRKPKAVNDGESLKTRAEKQAANQLDQNKNHEVLIGSISVTLGHCSYQEGNNLAEARDRSLAECQIPKKNNVPEKSSKLDPVQGVTNKFWRPVSRHGSKSSLPVQHGVREFEEEVVAEKDGVQTSSNESCLRSCTTDGSNGVVSMNLSKLEESVEPGSLQFDSHAAKAFLAQRWKEAIAGEHVTLVLSLNLEPPGCSVVEIDSSEKWTVKAGALESSTVGAAKGKFRTKPEKGAKLKYIPKQRYAT
ncbi:hypothetical protein CRYUN_Cryun19dG0081400 [Craigia yunnanensis]